MPPRQKATHESSPKTTMGDTTPEILPDPAVVREWDYKELQEYLKPLLSKFSDTTRKQFEDAELDGEGFLKLGSGKLPAGEGYEAFISAWCPRQVLKKRAMEILGDATGSEKSMFPFSSKLHILRTTAGNIDQAEGAQPDAKKLRKYDGNLVKAQILHAILWGKEDEVREKIFLKRTVTVPAFNESQTTELIECKRLDLGPLLVTYFENTPSAPVHIKNREFLPCASNSMLVRGAYEEAYGYISTRDANRRKQKGHSRLNTDRAVIMTGHPGIGKKWFLSYVLVERLLKSMPTIVQYSWDEIDATHILFDENGARLVTSFTRELANNSEIWVLCSQKPLGLAPLTDQHAWYLVIATAPNPSNTKAVKKHYPPFINMAQWTWAELVCTEYASFDHLLLKATNLKQALHQEKTAEKYASISHHVRSGT
jgi:hypothetical protein